MISASHPPAVGDGLGLVARLAFCELPGSGGIPLTRGVASAAPFLPDKER